MPPLGAGVRRGRAARDAGLEAVPSASWVSSEDWSGASPAGPARRPWPGPKAFFLEEAVAMPHWVRDT